MSTYVALYRKYRPSNFEEVSGQEHVVDLLSKSLKSGKVAHAYIFAGGRGTGKTSVARIFARDLGSNPEDIIEIDAASNRGIDEIRELREAVRSLPFTSKFKVYIIDEAHMLTREAANALLKTLEEPPSHVIFILATTDKEKLPLTILSRCQQVEFKQPDIDTLSSKLIDVSEKEKRILAKEAASLIARHGKGSYRDSLGILEQILGRVEHKNISVEHVNEMIGLPEEDLVVELLESICAKDEKKSLEILTQAKKSGIDGVMFYEELIEAMRQALLLRVGAKDIKTTFSKEAEEKLAQIGVKYAKVINSALIFKYLDSAKYLNVSGISPYIGFETVVLS